MDTPTDLERIAQDAINEALKRRKASGQRMTDIIREIGTTSGTIYKYKTGQNRQTLRAFGSLLMLINGAPNSDKAA